METIRVSVVILARGADASLERTIRSVLAQDAGVEEVLVVDDGSSDPAGESSGAFGPTVSFLRPARRGPAAAGNAGVAAAAGDVIALLAPGEEWLRSASRVLAEPLLRAREIGIVFGDPAPEPGGARAPVSGGESPASAADVFEALLGGGSLPLSAALFRAGLFREHRLRFAEDLSHCWSEDFLLRASRICRIAHVDAEVVRTLPRDVGLARSAAVLQDRVLMLRRLRNDLREQSVRGQAKRCLESRLADCERLLGVIRLRAGAYRTSQELFAASLTRDPSFRTAGLLLASLAGPRTRPLWKRALPPASE